MNRTCVGRGAGRYTGFHVRPGSLPQRFSVPTSGSCARPSGADYLPGRVQEQIVLVAGSMGTGGYGRWRGVKRVLSEELLVGGETYAVANLGLQKWRTKRWLGR